MTKSITGFVKGMSTGIAVGCTLGAIGSNYMRKNKKGLKKNIGRALRSVSDIMEDMNGMF